jgi:hypothetical protein
MPQSGEPPFFGRDKWKMVKACHLSFLKAGNSDRTYILDNCPDSWRKYFSHYGEVINTNLGKIGSRNFAFETAANMKGKILFLEDDYIWRPDTLPVLEKSLDHFKIVTPYNHPDHYPENATRSWEMTKFAGFSWRHCITGTHTFATTSEVINENYDIFVNSPKDWIMFTELEIKGIPLFCPAYSMATHLVKGKLALGTDWSKLIINL